MALEWRETPTWANQSEHESKIHRKEAPVDEVKPQVTKANVRIALNVTVTFFLPRNWTFQHLGDKGGDWRALASCQSHMGKKRMAL